MTNEMNQLEQGNAGARDMEVLLSRLADLGTRAPTPGQVKREGLKAKILDALRQYGNLTAAALAAGVSRTTIYRWRDEDPAFAAEVNQWMHEGMEEELANNLFRIAASTDPKMATAAVRANEVLLKAHFPGKYGDRLQLDHTLTVNVATQTVDAYMERQRQAMQQLERSVSPVIEAEFTAVVEEGRGEREEAG